MAGLRSLFIFFSWPPRIPVPCTSKQGFGLRLGSQVEASGGSRTTSKANLSRIMGTVP